MTCGKIFLIKKTVGYYHPRIQIIITSVNLKVLKKVALNVSKRGADYDRLKGSERV